MDKLTIHEFQMDFLLFKATEKKIPKKTPKNVLQWDQYHNHYTIFIQLFSMGTPYLMKPNLKT